MRVLLVQLPILILLSSLIAAQDPFPVSIIHLNDFHARFDETNTISGSCKPGDKCIGGYARVVTKIRELMEARKETNPIYLNVGDNFQGTLYYNMFRHSITSHFLNLLPADATTLGNHEFDDGLDGVLPYIKNSSSPILVCNIDPSEEPDFIDTFQKSLVIEKYNRRIGIIGVILETTNTITNLGNLGKLKFHNETEAVREEAAVLRAQGVDIIIVLSHAGYPNDKIIAEFGGEDIDVIVGGHSHIFLYTGGDPPGTDNIAGGYPTIITQESGHKVYIVTASAYTKYLGDITFYFDEEGKVVSYEGAPIYLDESVEKAQDIVEELAEWKQKVDAVGDQVVGYSNVRLDKASCLSKECNLGNLMASSYVHVFVDRAEKGSWTYASLAIANNGGIRTQLFSGELTYGDVVASLPFEHTVDVVEVTGQILWQIMEQSWSDTFYSLQTAGMRAEVNLSMPIGERLRSLQLLCNECLIPKYEPVDLAKVYRVAMQSYLVTGGDGFDIIYENKLKHETSGVKDIEAFTSYIELMSPITTTVTGRIKFL